MVSDPMHRGEIPRSSTKQSHRLLRQKIRRRIFAGGFSCLDTWSLLFAEAFYPPHGWGPSEERIGRRAEYFTPGVRRRRTAGCEASITRRCLHRA